MLEWSWSTAEKDGMCKKLARYNGIICVDALARLGSF